MKPLKGKMNVCHPCKPVKATKKSFKSHFKPVQYAGEIVHSDLAGPIPKSIDDAVYICTVTDLFSRFSHGVGLSKKSDALRATEEYMKLSSCNKVL